MWQSDDLAFSSVPRYGTSPCGMTRDDEMAVKKQTASDAIKTALSLTFGGIEPDWKRVSKNGGVRVFRHEPFDLTVTVTGNEALAEDGRVIPLITTPPQDPQCHTPEAIQAAEEVIRLMRSGSYRDDIPDDLLKTAGNALAKHFLFVVASDPDLGGPYAVITPQWYWESDGCCYDQQSPLEEVLPDGDDVNGCGTYCFDGVFATEQDLYTYLFNKGFTFDQGFKVFMDQHS